MDTDFSESSFAYAATREVEDRLRTHGHTLLTAPRIPTLREEFDLGYDVRIDTNSVIVILQFKTGEFVSRHHPRSVTWPLAGLPHYRMRFPAGHHQLRALQGLEAAITRPGASAVVRYLAPEFWEQKEFTDHYLSSAVLEHSYGCRPLQVPADGAEHHLIRVPAAMGTSRRTILMSDPREINEENVGATIDQLTQLGTVSDEVSVDPIGPPLGLQLTQEALEIEALALGVDAGALRNAADTTFRDRPNMAAAAFALTLAASLGIFIGLTARVTQTIDITSK